MRNDNEQKSLDFLLGEVLAPSLIFMWLVSGLAIWKDRYDSIEELVNSSDCLSEDYGFESR